MKGRTTIESRAGSAGVAAVDPTVAVRFALRKYAPTDAITINATMPATGIARGRFDALRLVGFACGGAPTSSE